MVHLAGYDLGTIAGPGNAILNLKQGIIENLANLESALELLTGSKLKYHMRWIVISSLVRDNPMCPFLFDLRYQYVDVLAKLSEQDRKDCWAKIRCSLNKEERKLFEVEEIRYDLILALAIPLLTATAISYGIYSVTELFGDDPEDIILGSFLIFIIVVILFCIVGYCFEKFRRRSYNRLF